MKVASWWEKLNNSQVKCKLCPKECIISKNCTGFCNTRQNIDGILYTLVYGYPCAVNIDPVEKKPLFHFYPGSQVFSLGTIGCNLDCKFCQNYEIARSKIINKNNGFISPKDIVDNAIKHNCKSIAFTYNEPTVFGEYVLDIAKIAKEKNLKTIMVTNGYINSQPLKEIYKYIDAANIDLKGITEEFYQSICNGNLDDVLSGIKMIYQMGVFVEITNLIVPGLNDDESMIINLIQWIFDNLGQEIPLHFSAFYPHYKLNDISKTPKSILDNALKLAIKKGFHYVYEGNVLTSKNENTYCPNCRKKRI